MSQRTDLLHRILARNDLQRPDGRMLCKYRCAPDEFKAIEEYFRETVSYTFTFPQHDQIFGALFCMYAAEWWRQNYSGRQWTYWGILESLGADPDLNRQELYGPIRGGLKYWKRYLLKVGESNAYLVTLACEAGLPLNILHSDKDSHFRRYLRNLLREFQIYGGQSITPFDLASRLGQHLPKGLKQKPLYQICGELIENVWSLQRQVGDVENPIEKLNELCPTWRETLPLVVSDEAAEALLSNLVREATSLTRVKEIRISASLLKTTSGFLLSRSISLPAYFDQKSLSEMLNFPGSDLPYRMQIFDCGNEHPRVVCLITRRSMEGDGRFAVEVPAKESLEWDGQSAAQTVYLQARFNDAAVELPQIKGSMSLSDLPWVFTSKGAGNRWEMIGEGSLKTKHQEVVAALSVDADISMKEGHFEFLGDLECVKRKLFRIFGHAIIDQDGIRTVIRTSAIEDDSSQYLLYGNFLTSGAYKTKVYKGFPKLQRSFEGGGTIQIQKEQLEWKARGSTESWRSVSSECIGPVQLRFASEGEVRFIADVDIVPATCAICFIPSGNIRTGTVELSGFNLDDCGLECTGEINISKHRNDDNFRFVLSCQGQPPGSIPLHLLWPGHREIIFHIPYPARGVRFVGRDGRVLRSEEKVHISQLGGVLVQVMEPEKIGNRYLIEASVLSKKINYSNYQLKSEGPYLTEVTPGHHEFDLRQLEERCRLLFSGTKDLDAWIRVGIISNAGDQFPQKIYIARYDMTLEPNKQTGEVSIPDDERTAFLNMIDNLKVRAFPLDTPEVEEMEQLTQVSQGIWDFSPQKRATGPWLLTGWSGDWCRTRPLLWTISLEGEDGKFVNADHIGSIERAVCIPDTQNRFEEIDLILDRLRLEPGNCDWEKVYAYFSLTHHLPAPTFDVLVRITKKPDVAAACLLNASEDVFDVVWTGLRRLPFDWALIPVKAWIDAAKERQKHLSDVFQEVSTITQQPVEQLIFENFKKFSDRSQARFCGIKPIIDLIYTTVLSKPLGETELAPLTQNAHRKILAGYCIADPAQILMQDHADSYWPEIPGLIENWWPKYKVQVPDELHALWRIIPSPGYRSSVLTAPVAAAMSSAFNLHMNKYFQFNIRRLREFDRDWFDSVYGCVLASCIGYRIEHGMAYEDE